MKIILGTHEIVGHIVDYEKGFESLGCQVFTIVERKVPRFEHLEYNYVMDEYLHNLKSVIFLRKIRFIAVYLLKYCLLFYHLINADLLLLLWPERFVNWRIFIPLIKAINKRLRIVFCPSGSDIRWRPATYQEFLSNNFYLHEDFIKRTNESTLENLIFSMETLRVFEKYADIIYSQPNQSQMALRPYKHYNLPIQTAKIKFNIPDNVVPVIVHGATDRTVKGTKYVEMIIDRLKSNGIPHKFICFEKLSNDEFLKLLSDSDIVVYNPFGTTTGKFGLEAIFSGCLLLTGIKKSYQPFPANSPLIEINPENLYEKLVFFLNDKSEREKIIYKQYEWAKKYFDTGQVCKNIISDMEELQKRKLKYDYHPTFFRNNYKPFLGDKECVILNKHTKSVKKCNWYLEYVAAGKREGLVF